MTASRHPAGSDRALGRTRDGVTLPPAHPLRRSAAVDRAVWAPGDQVCPVC